MASEIRQIDVFVPLYNAEPFLSSLLLGIRKQKKVLINKIVFCITDSKDNTLPLVEQTGYSYFCIKPSEFSHSCVREEGMKKCSSPIVIFLSQDVILERDDVFYNLTKDLGRNGIVHCFAKQISKSKGIEEYTREKNYPSESYIVEKKDIPSLQIKAFFSSDACAAYDRLTFQKLNGFDHKQLQVSEDMYYCRKALMAGYKIKYCSDAVVTHSHNLSLKQVYHRYYDIGIFFGQCPEFKQYKSNGAGLSLAFYILKRALFTFNFPVLIRFLPEMAARFFGKKKGIMDYERKHKKKN